MANRETIPKRIRFEVLKRDSFTCQYCGASAPNVLLQIDHIIPVSKGGDNDIMNLITSCDSCNSGKSNIKLSDNSAMQKRKYQLDLLQEKREQIELMIEWQNELLDLDNVVVSSVAQVWNKLAGTEISKYGLAKISLLLKKYSYEDLINAIQIACKQYLGKKDSNEIFNSLEGICYNKKIEEKDPVAAAKNHIKNTLQRNLGYFNYKTGMKLINDAIDFGATTGSLLEFAKSVKSWTQFRDGVQTFIEQQKQENENELH